MKRSIALLLGLALVVGLAPSAMAAEDTSVYEIVLSAQETEDGYTHTATLDGQALPEYDYVWHADPTTDHGEVEDSPAEYYTGTAPTGEDRAYIAHDIIHYPELDQEKFQQVSYDGETEWVYMYEAPGYEEFIFSTLPALRTGFPTQMMHSEEEAYSNAVLHITQPGTYRLTGTWHGQIWVDLGEEAFDDPACKVTLILNGVDITCTVAPGVVFANVYECDNTWEDRTEFSHEVDTSDAGANVILADGTVNTVYGTNVFRILKTKYKDEDATDPYPAQKKAWKMDGAFYSYQTMNIAGEEAGTGVLEITSGNEGLNSELHLTIDSGTVNISSQDDGINVNEDGVSVLTVNGGTLHICAGLGAEGDGVDSNGFLTINAGTVICAANPASDSGLDSDCGSFVNGGVVVALGSAMDWAENDEGSDSVQPVVNLQFSTAREAGDAIILADEDGKVVFAYDPSQDELAGENARTYQGAIISAPTLQMGQSYRLYIGGQVEGQESGGVYDVTTVTGFTGATRQSYGGNGTTGGMDRPEDQFPGGELTDGQIPEGQFPGGEMPGGEIPEGQFPGGEMPDGEMPGGQIPGGQMPGDMAQTGAGCAGEAAFTLTERVSVFTAVSDYTHTMTENDDGSFTCTHCGLSVSPAEAQNQEPQETPQDGTSTDWVLAGAAIFAGVAMLALAVVLIVLYRKKKQG